ncbi:hypothetical protein [Psittacicella gerlachiana]|uniref:DUF4375 domain-containing protein n=1 Tax=Psittacicella gerlachiana TaxID=2028574 RepID=A0A3A1YB98_9GAMM|nr:hypothetical protein [Psittacicella gerlachiana]RIY34821.1 hypothetical protein CKF59_04650 [Psittacicella gerlachiana]
MRVFKFILLGIILGSSLGMTKAQNLPTPAQAKVEIAKYLNNSQLPWREMLSGMQRSYENTSKPVKSFPYLAGLVQGWFVHYFPPRMRNGIYTIDGIVDFFNIGDLCYIYLQGNDREFRRPCQTAVASAATFLGNANIMATWILHLELFAYLHHNGKDVLDLQQKKVIFDQLYGVGEDRIELPAKYRRYLSFEYNDIMYRYTPEQVEIIRGYWKEYFNLDFVKYK